MNYTSANLMCLQDGRKCLQKQFGV
jgi:hypothetical protein